MAKKRKEASEEEELDFTIPEFDEEKFLKRERRNIKTMLIAFGFGILISLISFGLWALMSESNFRWMLVLMFGVVCGVWIRYLFLRLNIDLTDFGRRGWFSSLATYFVTWLIVLVVLVNPPFYDGEKPSVDVAVLPGMQELGGTVKIVAHIIDNVGVHTDGIDFTVTYPNGTMIHPAFSYTNNIFEYVYENPENILGQYTFSLTVTDVNGHINDTYVNKTFEYNNNALQIISSSTTLISGDLILIKADKKINPDNNFRVYYTVNDGAQINTNRRDPKDKEEYETSPKYKGWHQESNHTIKIYAEVTHYFTNQHTKYSNIVKDTTTYLYTTKTDPNIGTTEPLKTYNCTLPLLMKNQEENTINYALPCPHTVVATPGFELLASLLAIVFVLLIYRRKKER
ncbi:MAG: hypothetical protein QXX20_01785 [Candidatus Thermoplasmatota archaeon]